MVSPFSPHQGTATTLVSPSSNLFLLSHRTLTQTSCTYTNDVCHKLKKISIFKTLGDSLLIRSQRDYAIPTESSLQPVVAAYQAGRSTIQAAAASQSHQSDACSWPDNISKPPLLVYSPGLGYCLLLWILDVTFPVVDPALLCPPTGCRFLHRKSPCLCSSADQEATDFISQVKTSLSRPAIVAFPAWC